VRSADRKTLPARDRDAPHLLRSRLLRGSLRKRVPASREPGKSIMNLLAYAQEGIAGDIC
jgi:hypothetical protein